MQGGPWCKFTPKLPGQRAPGLTSRITSKQKGGSASTVNQMWDPVNTAIGRPDGEQKWTWVKNWTGLSHNPTATRAQ